MKKTWFLITAATLLALTVVIVATFPAALAWRWWGERAPDLKLQGVSGTIWNGTATRVAVRGQSLGRLQWQVPLLRLLGGNPGVSIDLSGPGMKLKADIAGAADGALAISRLAAEAEAGWLGPALAIPELEPTGLLVTDGASLLLSRTGLPRAIDARIEWRDAGVRGQVVARLGTLVIEAHGKDGRIEASVADQGDGDVEVLGGALIDQGSYRSETILVPRVTQGPVVEALQWVGTPRPEGGRLLVVEGRIMVLEETL
jgi:general secretion pathway protein N